MLERELIWGGHCRVEPHGDHKMIRDELLRMIRVANLLELLCPDLDEHLPFYDDKVLTGLAHLAK